MSEPPELITPRIDFREEFIAYCEEFQAADEPFVHGQLADARRDFAGLIERWAGGAKGLDSPPDGYLGKTYWLVRSGRILASARLRTHLTERQAYEDGHVGYDVRPSERNKGYASLLLKLLLGKARDAGLAKVLVSCQKDNRASARVIEKNGGVFEREIVSRDNGRPALRYWIDL